MSNICHNFEGKVVLITGAGSGIGASTALQFAKSGANVILTDKNGVKLSEVAEQCRQISPKCLKPLQVLADMTKEEDLKQLVDCIIEKYGKLDVLVNNAGYFEERTITDPDYIRVYDSLMQINLNSLVTLTHLCVKHLAKTKGNIINTSSVNAVVSGSRMTAYKVTKAGVDMFTKCMAAELGSKGIRVNSVNPGAVKTGIMEPHGYNKIQSDAFFNAIGQRYPVGRAGEPQDIANAILFLASDNSSFITGTNLVVDGGHIAANIRD